MVEHSETTLLPEAFDPQQQEGSHFDLVPAGWYDAQIIEATVCQSQTAKGSGHYLKLSWQITEEGDYENRYVWQNITFLHDKSVQAVEIGRRNFKDLCDATSISEQVSDVSIFKFKPCRIRVGIAKDKDGLYDDQNKVTRVKPLNSPEAHEAKAAPKPPARTPPTAAQPKPATASTAAGNGSVAPWRKPNPPLAEDLNDEVPQ